MLMKIHARVINDEDYADSERNITYDYAQNFVDDQNSFCFIEAGTLDNESAFLIDIVFYSKRNADVI